MTFHGHRQHVATRRCRSLCVAAISLVGFITSVTACDSDSDDSATATADDGGVVLPQDPSLAITLEDGTWVVENDGNVTMSDVEVRDDAGAVVCEIGTLAPEDSAPCDEGADLEGLVAFGVGPQGQEVEVESE